LHPLRALGCQGFKLSEQLIVDGLEVEAGDARLGDYRVFLDEI
jgi:hypothetical protein